MPRKILAQFTSKKGNTYTLYDAPPSGNYRIIKNNSAFASHALRFVAEQKFKELKERYA